MSKYKLIALAMKTFKINKLNAFKADNKSQVSRKSLPSDFEDKTLIRICEIFVTKHATIRQKSTGSSKALEHKVLDTNYGGTSANHTRVLYSSN